jgi:hypothetical protein
MLMVNACLAPVTSRVGKMDPDALVNGRARPIISWWARDSVNFSKIRLRQEWNAESCRSACIGADVWEGFVIIGSALVKRRELARVWVDDAVRKHALE